MQERIDAALEGIFQIMEERPDKNSLRITQDLLAGRRPSSCPISLGRVQHFTEVARPGVEMVNRAPQAPEDRLVSSLEGLAKGPQNENLWSPVLGLGFGTCDMATAFGSEPDLGNPTNPGGVVEYLPLESFDDMEEAPDLGKAGLFPLMKEYIDLFKASTPPDIKIGFPDMQGPINVAHMILGTELFLAMYTEPTRLHHLLQLITDHLINVFTTFPRWIGADRMIPGPAASKRIAECSVNLISRENYREFGLPYDRQIAEALGEIAIHTCGGNHVFEETLHNLPVVYTEWADCRNAFAPQVTLEHALEEIGDRPIMLSGGAEIWEGDPEAFIKEHLATLEDHPLQTFGYSGMHWRAGDEPLFTAIHRRLDAYYEERYAS